ncbi:condensation domain-containing protein, partial [Streptomyces sp. MCAF7]
VVQGAWAIVLGWLTGRDDVVFGVTVSGRPPEIDGIDTMVGLFINTVPARVPVVQGAWAIVLGWLTGRDDVVFGVTVSGRPPEIDGIDTMVGLFINTVPARVRLRPDETFPELLTRVQDEQARLLDHHHIGLTDIQRRIGTGRLFDTLLVYENYPHDPDALRAASKR